MKLKFESKQEEEEKVEPMFDKDIKVECNEESINSTIVKTVKKKSFLKSFISPDRPKLVAEI